MTRGDLFLKERWATWSARISTIGECLFFVIGKETAQPFAHRAASAGENFVCWSDWKGERTMSSSSLEASASPQGSCLI